MSLTTILKSLNLFVLCVNCVQCQWFFGSWNEDVTIPFVEPSKVEPSPVTGVNNEMLLKAEMMGLHFVHFLNCCIIAGECFRLILCSVVACNILNAQLKAIF